MTYEEKKAWEVYVEHCEFMAGNPVLWEELSFLKPVLAAAAELTRLRSMAIDLQAELDKASVENAGMRAIVQRVEDVEGMAKALCSDDKFMWELIDPDTRNDYLGIARAVRDYLLKGRGDA